MAAKQKILIVDDDSNIAELISLYLDRECYDTKIAADGEEALKAVSSYEPDLILLDLMLPGIDGYQVCREVRSRNDTPIIMLSAKGEIFDKVLGLELGADDYEKSVSYPDLSISLTNYSVIYMGEHIDMPPKELELLYFLAAAPNRVFTREQLLDQIWGYDYAGDTRTVDVHIKRLREKIRDHKSWKISTIWGVGYKFDFKG